MFSHSWQKIHPDVCCTSGPLLVLEAVHKTCQQPEGGRALFLGSGLPLRRPRRIRYLLGHQPLAL